MLRIASAVCVAAFFAAGCFSAVTPRTAGVAEAGSVATQAAVVLLTWSPGRLDDAPGNTSPGTPLLHALQVIFPYALEVGLRIGVGGGCEVGLVASLFRPGVEGRCAIVREEDGAPASVTAAGMLAYQWLMSSGSWWTRGGFDISGGEGDDGGIANLYVSYGPERHSLRDPIQDNRGHMPTFRAVTRDELRLTAGFGVALTADPAVFTPALLPYWTMWAGDARDTNDATSRRRLEETWGVGLGVGVGFADSAAADEERE